VIEPKRQHYTVKCSRKGGEVLVDKKGKDFFGGWGESDNRSIKGGEGGKFKIVKGGKEHHKKKRGGKF